MTETESPAGGVEGMSNGEKLAEFYNHHGVGEKNGALHLLEAPYRFIRIHPEHDRETVLKQLRTELAPEDAEFPMAVPWLDPSFRFYALPSTFRLQQSPTFRAGHVYGQDVSSGAAVSALLTDHHHEKKETTTPTNGNAQAEEETLGGWRVLDLCCAPGLKLCAMADWLREKRPGSTVIGVDLSTTRMQLTQKLVEKYQINPNATSHDKIEIRLYENDGTTFGSCDQNDNKNQLNLVFDSNISLEEARQAGKRKRKNKSAKARERKRLKERIDSDVLVKHQAVASEEVRSASIQRIWRTMQQFDRVLVDAECSTDGSIKHMQKRLEKSIKLETPEDLAPKLTDARLLSELVELQRKLAASGFRLLKPGGIMVYSTCSLSEDQNESVVGWLLAEFPEATLVPVTFDKMQKGDSRLVREGKLDGTVRFLPNVTPMGGKTKATTTHKDNLFGGGFFLAKLKKAA